MDDAIAQLEQALSLAKSLNKAAQTANNHHTDEETQRGRLKDALKDLKEAGLIQTAPAGIATATEQSQLHTANENIHLVSYVTAKRLKRAKFVLVHTDKPVLRIAAELDFTPLNYFSRQFKKHIGVTPSEYRREHSRRAA